MGTGVVLIIIDAIVVAFSSITAVGVMNGRVEEIVTVQEKLGVTIFFIILLFVGWILLYNGILIINL
jgi:hypothetical protein|nr:MAG TPA: hypothetical protein [Caudoviricetes sp.]